MIRTSPQSVTPSPRSVTAEPVKIDHGLTNTHRDPPGLPAVAPVDSAGYPPSNSAPERAGVIAVQDPTGSSRDTDSATTNAPRLGDRSLRELFRPEGSAVRGSAPNDASERRLRTCRRRHRTASRHCGALQVGARTGPGWR